tara:strand:+ start:143 stop:1015 length:873 start_codon:yes stop_codon:yes gene_type:complete
LVAQPTFHPIHGEKMKVVLFDAMNLIHRSRNGFHKGDHPLTYQFFRSLKPLLEKLRPDLAYFVLEGKPKHRSQVYDGYKSNRPSLPDSFWRQQGEILNIMQHLPIVQIRHPDYECDDVIANLAKCYTDTGNNVVIVSGDSDFIQVFDSMDHDKISIYHPIKKAFIEKPDYIYLDWKALRGDASDNIPGIKGVGDKTATKIINNPQLMKETLSDPSKRNIFDRNRSLIAFHWFKDLSHDLQNAGLEVTYPVPSMENVMNSFKDMGFDSMLSEKYWPKFEAAFSSLDSGAST